MDPNVRNGPWAPKWVPWAVCVGLLVACGLGLGLGGDVVDWVTYLIACAAAVAVGMHLMGQGEAIGLGL